MSLVIMENRNALVLNGNHNHYCVGLHKKIQIFFSAGLVGFLQFLSVLYHLDLID